MLRTKKYNCKVLFTVIFFFHGLLALAQTSVYPVQVNAVGIPPYSMYLNEYYEGFSEQLSVTLLNKDFQQPEVRVKLRLTIHTASGLTMTTKPEAFFNMIRLESGVPTRLSMADLAPYFLPRNLNVQGNFINETLPEGRCEFRFEALDYGTGRHLSSTATAVVFLKFLQPPVPQQPVDKSGVVFTEPLNLSFRWTPASGSFGLVEYEFILKEILDTQADINAAFLYSPVVYRTTTTSTLLPYTLDLPLLNPGKKYAWQLRAMLPNDIGSKNRFQNNGYSTISSFEIREDCKAPTLVTAAVDRGNVILSWQALPGVAEYEISYRRKNVDSDVWSKKRTNENSVYLTGLIPGQPYVYRIGSLCSGGLLVYSHDFFVDAPTVERQANCGKQPDIDISNRALKSVLVPGETVMAGDFPVKITEVYGSNGIFSGKGEAKLPYIGIFPLAVKFNNITVNTDNKLIGGFFETLYDKRESSVSNLDKYTEGGASQLTGGIITPDITVNFTIPPVPIIEYNDEASIIEIFDENHTSVGKIPVPKNDVASVFPMIVMDEEGNLYRLEESDIENTNTKINEFNLVTINEQKGNVSDDIDELVATKKVNDLITVLQLRIREYLRNNNTSYQKMAFENENRLPLITEFDPMIGANGMYKNGKLYVGRRNFVENSSDEDILSTIYHEFMHHLNWQFGDRYRMEDLERGIVYSKNVECFEERMQSQDDFLEDIYYTFILSKMATTQRDIYLTYPEIYEDLDSEQKKEVDIYIKENTLKPEIVCFSYDYSPSNFFKDEINAHTETINASDKIVFKMSDKKNNIYRNEINRYTNEYNKAKMYEINNNINADGYEK
jgi:hypothetical protein